jgi:hypothetical protein
MNKLNKQENLKINRFLDNARRFGIVDHDWKTSPDIRESNRSWTSNNLVTTVPNTRENINIVKEVMRDNGYVGGFHLYCRGPRSYAKSAWGYLIDSTTLINATYVAIYMRNEY